MLPIVGNMVGMQLMAYLNDRKETVAQFAARLDDTSIGAIHKIAYRQRQPSLTLAMKISAATSGLVGPADMALTDEEKARAASPQQAAA